MLKQLNVIATTIATAAVLSSILSVPINAEVLTEDVGTAPRHADSANQWAKYCRKGADGTYVCKRK